MPRVTIRAGEKATYAELKKERKQTNNAEDEELRLAIALSLERPPVTAGVIDEDLQLQLATVLSLDNAVKKTPPKVNKRNNVLRAAEKRGIDYANRGRPSRSSARSSVTTTSLCQTDTDLARALELSIESFEELGKLADNPVKYNVFVNGRPSKIINFGGTIKENGEYYSNKCGLLCLRYFCKKQDLEAPPIAVMLAAGGLDSRNEEMIRDRIIINIAGQLGLKVAIYLANGNVQVDDTLNGSAIRVQKHLGAEGGYKIIWINSHYMVLE